MGNWFVVVGLIGVLWALQLYLAHRQAMAFMAEVRRLRGAGLTAIGASSMSRMRRRTYAALAATGGVVVDAVSLSGITVWARPRPAPTLLGRRLEDLAAAEDARDRLLRAAAMAARSLLGTDDEDPDEEEDAAEARGVEEVSGIG